MIEADDMIVTGYKGKFIKIWNFYDKKIKSVLYGHTDTVNCLTYTKSKVLISGGADSKIIFWNLSTK